MPAAQRRRWKDYNPRTQETHGDVATVRQCLCIDLAVVLVLVVVVVVVVFLRDKQPARETFHESLTCPQVGDISTLQWFAFRMLLFTFDLQIDGVGDQQGRPAISTSLSLAGPQGSVGRRFPRCNVV